jgi:hypothetical protein
VSNEKLFARVNEELRLREIMAKIDESEVFVAPLYGIAKIKTKTDDGRELPGKARLKLATQPSDRWPDGIETIETDWLHPGSQAEFIARQAKGMIGKRIAVFKHNVESDNPAHSQGYRQVVWIRFVGDRRDIDPWPNGSHGQPAQAETQVQREEEAPAREAAPEPSGPEQGEIDWLLRMQSQWLAGEGLGRKAIFDEYMKSNNLSSFANITAERARHIRQLVGEPGTEEPKAALPADYPMDEEPF